MPTGARARHAVRLVQEDAPCVPLGIPVELTGARVAPARQVEHLLVGHTQHPHGVGPELLIAPSMRAGREEPALRPCPPVQVVGERLRALPQAEPAADDVAVEDGILVGHRLGLQMSAAGGGNVGGRAVEQVLRHPRVLLADHRVHETSAARCHLLQKRCRVLEGHVRVDLQPEVEEVEGLDRMHRVHNPFPRQYQLPAGHVPRLAPIWRP